MAGNAHWADMVGFKMTQAKGLPDTLKVLHANVSLSFFGKLVNFKNQQSPSIEQTHSSVLQPAHHLDAPCRVLLDTAILQDAYTDIPFLMIPSILSNTKAVALLDNANFPLDQPIVEAAAIGLACDHDTDANFVDR